MTATTVVVYLGLRTSGRCGMRDRWPTSVDIVIVGGGFAGAATAWGLARRGVSDVLVLEASDQFGSQASGRNASMVRQLSSDPWTSRLLRQSVARILGPEATLGVEARRCGSLLLFEEPAGKMWLPSSQRIYTACA